MLTHNNLNNKSFLGQINKKNYKLFKTIYQFMYRLRKIELKIKNEYHPKDLMKCPVHLCIGQEAVPSALSVILKNNDYLFSHHRSHGYYFAKNCAIKDMISELYGKSTGANMGFAGSQDISNHIKKFFAGAILSGSVGIAIGTAFAIKFKNLRSKVVVAFGEGALDQGIFWEAINLAALYKLPILFVCENNLYATYSSLKDRVHSFDICKKVSSFGVNSKQVFGNDAVKVHDEIKLKYKNLKNEPFFFEFLTYRISSHVGPENDSINYRNNREIKKWIDLCPIKNLEEKLKLSKKEIKLYEKKVKSEIDNAFKFASTSKFKSVKDWQDINLPKQKNIKIKIKELDDHSLSKKDTTPEPY